MFGLLCQPPRLSEYLALLLRFARPMLSKLSAAAFSAATAFALAGSIVPSNGKSCNSSKKGVSHLAPTALLLQVFLEVVVVLKGSSISLLSTTFTSRSFFHSICRCFHFSLAFFWKNIDSTLKFFQSSIVTHFSGSQKVLLIFQTFLSKRESFITNFHHWNTTTSKITNVQCCSSSHWSWNPCCSMMKHGITSHCNIRFGFYGMF